MRLASVGLSRFNTKALGLQLLFKRFDLESTPAVERAKAIHNFFEKYEKILSNEISQLSKL